MERGFVDMSRITPLLTSLVHVDAHGPWSWGPAPPSESNSTRFGVPDGAERPENEGITVILRIIVTVYIIDDSGRTSEVRIAPFLAARYLLVSRRSS
jgi:hypothetical protein